MWVLLLAGVAGLTDFEMYEPPGYLGLPWLYGMEELENNWDRPLSGQFGCAREVERHSWRYSGRSAISGASQKAAIADETRFVDMH